MFTTGIVNATGGGAAPKTVGGAVQAGAGAGGGPAGWYSPGGGAEAGDADDGQERLPGQGER